MELELDPVQRINEDGQSVSLEHYEFKVEIPRLALGTPLTELITTINSQNYSARSPSSGVRHVTVAQDRESGIKLLCY